MIDRRILIAALAVAAVLGAYTINFHLSDISPKAEVWGQFGDYIGGTLNPILSFISLLLIVRSLGLQNESNKAFRDELYQSRKSEDLKSFENKFFKMIEVQSAKFQRFKINSCDDVAEKSVYSAEAVVAIEDEISRLRSNSSSDEEIATFLKTCDEQDQIFGSVRTFYTCAKFIVDHLSDSNGFSQKIRLDYMRTLINFTDFSLIRLNMMSIQFLDYEASRYLRACGEFNDIMVEVGLSYASY